MTDEVEALLERADQYLQSAALLLENGDRESCISRAYYAMYFAAEAALLDDGIETSTHRGVITTFGRNLVKEGPFPPEMGRLLSTTMQKRQVSDYDPNPGIPHEEAKEVLKEARGFVHQIAEYLAR